MKILLDDSYIDRSFEIAFNLDVHEECNEPLSFFNLLLRSFDPHPSRQLLSFVRRIRPRIEWLRFWWRTGALSSIVKRRLYRLKELVKNKRSGMKLYCFRWRNQHSWNKTTRMRQQHLTGETRMKLAFLSEYTRDPWHPLFENRRRGRSYDERTWPPSPELRFRIDSKDSISRS